MGVTAVSRTEVGLAQVGCVGIASAAVSHSEGSLVTRVAVQSRGPGGTHHEALILFTKGLHTDGYTLRQNWSANKNIF